MLMSRSENMKKIQLRFVIAILVQHPPQKNVRRKEKTPAQKFFKRNIIREKGTKKEGKKGKKIPFLSKKLPEKVNFKDVLKIKRELLYAFFKITLKKELPERARFESPTLLIKRII